MNHMKHDNLTVICSNGVCRLDNSFKAEEHDVDGQFDKLPDSFTFKEKPEAEIAKAVDVPEQLPPVEETSVIDVP